MRGAGDEAVVFHRESAATKQMRLNRLARRVKSADDKISYCFLNKASAIFMNNSGKRV